MSTDLKIIKKYYGEKMMHLCRELFATILNNSPGLLSDIILKQFEPNHYLYDELSSSYRIPDFKAYIYAFYDAMKSQQDESETTVVDPVTLMHQAGYTLYECKTEEDIQQFKKYYTPDEELCTFKGKRLDYCYVYFAVHDKALKLKREDFTNPNRQDAYGTSVISIQFTRDKSHTLSIKNRYNHTVPDPDATFSNNLDNIIPNLTKSFSEHYGMIQEYYQGINFYPIGFTRANNGKFYQYNYEIDNIYYCLNNIIIDNHQVIRLPKEKYLLADYFIIDLVNKEINSRVKLDSFPKTIGKIKKINILKNHNEKIVTITPEVGEDIIIILDKYNRIKSLTDNNLEIVPNNYLYYCRGINNLTLNNVTTIEYDFVHYNQNLTSISLPKVTQIGHNCLTKSVYLEEVNFPLLEQIGDCFMTSNVYLKSLVLPKVTSIGTYCLYNNVALKKLVMPNLVNIGKCSFGGNNGELETISLPNVENIGAYSFNSYFSVSKVYLPKVKTIGDNFLNYNLKLTEIDLPEVETIGARVLYRATALRHVILPNVKRVGDSFFDNAYRWETCYLPNLDNSKYSVFLNEQPKVIYKQKQLNKSLKENPNNE